MQADTAAIFMILSASVNRELENSQRKELNPELILAQASPITGIKSEVNALEATVDQYWERIDTKKSSMVGSDIDSFSHSL